MNLFTIYGYGSDNDFLARTPIELDADIVTIIPQHLLNLSQREVFVNLHKTNVTLANYLYLYPVIRVFKFIQYFKSLIRIASVPAWIILSVIFFPQSLNSSPDKYLYYSIYSIVNFLGIPALLLKFIPKVIGYIIKREMMRSF
jgi:hypothetical protein